ncbi:hypothetical protein OGZ01_21305 [Vibrio harveyi]|nr:hypothetical protein [Vibrio harveyi]
MLTSLKHKFHLENIETLRQHIEDQGEWIGGWGTYLSTPVALSHVTNSTA